MASPWPRIAGLAVSAFLAATLGLAACEGSAADGDLDDGRDVALSDDGGRQDLGLWFDADAGDSGSPDLQPEIQPADLEEPDDSPQPDGEDTDAEPGDATQADGDTLSDAVDDGGPDAVVPTTECDPEQQNCPNSDTFYCSTKGKCLAHPTLGLCPVTWKFIKPAALPEVPLPAVVDSPTEAEITPRSALTAPGTSCAEHPNALPYLKWAEEHRLVPTPTAWPETLAALLTASTPADLVCPSTFVHLRSWFLRQSGADLALAGLAQSTVVAQTFSGWTKGEGYLWTRVRFEVPELGPSTGLLAVPAGEGPFPGVLLLHGHFSSADESFLEQAGANMARAGMVVFAPDSRSYQARIGGASCEAAIARSLWDQVAMPLIGLQLREELSALAYLRARPEVDPTRIGVNSHSGGAQRAMAVGLAVPSVRVVARDDDFSSRLYWPCEAQSGPECELQPHCTVVPAITEPVRDALQRQSAVPFVQATRPYQSELSPEAATALAALFADLLSP
ncbi:MAG: dienelactone hydrolase family protein [Myxococcota bacterium]